MPQERVGQRRKAPPRAGKVPGGAEGRFSLREISAGRPWNFCWVLPGLDNVSCLSGPVRPLRLVVCVISSLPSARLSPEGSHLLSYLCTCIVRYRTCMHSCYVRYVYCTSLRAQALALVLVFG